MKHTLADFHSVANAADSAAGTDAALALWKEVIAIAECQPGLQRQSRVSYILGLAHYALAEAHPESEALSERFFRLAIEDDANDSYAKLYLGHLAFDSGQYAAALEWFDAIPEGTFAAKDQVWRDLKKQELRICCLINLGCPDSLEQEFETYLAIATDCETTDVLTVSELPRLLALLTRKSS